MKPTMCVWLPPSIEGAVFTRRAQSAVLLRPPHHLLPVVTRAKAYYGGKRLHGHSITLVDCRLVAANIKLN